jgi:outer membrane lipoprotein-sorting protein
MAAIPKFSRRGRWVVPAGVVTAIAAVGIASAITVAQAAPALPPRTPAQLLAAIAGDTSNLPPLTGTVVETASLGIPQLPGAENPASLTSLLAGSHTLKIWYDGPSRLRLAAPVTLGETDLIRNGSTAWLWQSNNDSVTKFVLPAGHGMQAREKQARQPAMPHAPLTPQQAAQQALKIAGRSTRVTTEANVVVAGQDAYQLVLAPRSGGSQIARITIALDAQHLNVPLRVQVFAKGQSAPAFQVGYTSISFVAPAASNFDFTPPPGARVHTENLGLPGGSAAASGQMPKGEASGMQVIGKGWTSVAVLPEADVLPGGKLTGVGSASSAAGVAGQAAKSVSGGGGAISGSAVLSAMFLAAHPVHGAWGSGKLLHTALVSMLITNGHVLVGAVTPSVLYADAAHVK